ncbi:TNR4 factor, partial [Brachypodius atriceps]|nr:TNR4 factor [Brachypodius atriceps]
GERMRSRCTASADTVCSPCQDGYFSSHHHHGFCRSCTVCQARECCDLGGKIPALGRSWDVPAGIPFNPAFLCRFFPECSRCPEGTFSRGRNENCQPWTNCSIFGKSTLRAGTATEDALC